MNKSIHLKLLQKSLSRLSQFSPSLTARFALRIFTHPRHFKRPDWEEEILKSSERFFFKNKLAGYRWGKKTHPIVILIHGWNGRGSQLAKFVAPLLKSDFQVVAIDGPAHGNSPGKESNPADFSKALASCQKELGRVHTIIGHSFGAGACVIGAAFFGLTVEKIVFIAGPCSYEGVMERFCKHMKLSAKTTKLFVGRINRMVGIKAEDLRISKLVQKISVQAMVVHDTKDLELPISEAEEIASHWSGALFLQTEGHGHFKILKSEEVIEKIAEFVKK